MQFTTIAGLIASLAMTATAAPSAGLDARQGVPRIRATFYREGSCGVTPGSPPWAEDTVFLQNAVTGLAGCKDLDVGPFPATFFNESMLTKTIRFYNIPCAELTRIDSGNHFDIAPGIPSPGCKALGIESWVTLP